MDTRGGWVQMSPAQATVMMLEVSISPQVTITGGTGARRALPFHVCLAIFGVPFGVDLGVTVIIAYFSEVVKGSRKAAEGGLLRIRFPSPNRPNHRLKKLKNGLFDILCALCYNIITEGASEMKAKEKR